MQETHKHLTQVLQKCFHLKNGVFLFENSNYLKLVGLYVPQYRAVRVTLRQFNLDVSIKTLKLFL